MEVPFGNDDPYRRVFARNRVGRLEGTHDEGQQVGGHLHGLGEFEADPAVVESGPGDLGAVRVGLQALRDDHRRLEGGLQVRLVPAGEHAAGVGGLALRSGDHVLGAVFVPVDRPIQTAQLVVDDSGVGDAEGVGAGGHGVLQHQRGSGVLVVVGDPGDRRLAVLSTEGRRLDVDLGGVEDDLIDGLRDADPNRDLPVEAELAQIRLEAEVVMDRDRGPGQPERVFRQLEASP